MIDGLRVVIFSCLDDWKQEAQQWRLRWVSKHHRWETNFDCILGRLTFLKTTLVDLKQKPPPLNARPEKLKRNHFLRLATSEKNQNSKKMNQ